MLGCATGISRHAGSQVTYEGPFAPLQTTPDNHIGKIVMLGGKSIETTGSATFSEITVLQLPLGKGTRPRNGHESQGRYPFEQSFFSILPYMKKGAC